MTESDYTESCAEHPAVCDCNYHENWRAAEASHRVEPKKHVILIIGAIILFCILLISQARAFVVRPAPSNQAIEQLQRLNENIEKLNYQRNPAGMDMRFPARADQKFTA